MKHKPLARQLTAQFFRGNVPMFALAVFAALTGGTLNLIVTWLMQQLIDAASGLPGALPLGKLAWITGGFILLCAALMLLKYASEPRFIEKALPCAQGRAFSCVQTDSGHLKPFRNSCRGSRRVRRRIPARRGASAAPVSRRRLRDRSRTGTCRPSLEWGGFPALSG